jgi:hypothetical protein
MKHILTLIAALLLAPPAARAADADTKTVRVFIFAGQSNMEGAVLVNRDSVRRSLGCLKGQDAGFPSDLVFTWRGTAHQEGGTTFFGSKISWRGRTATTALNDWADMRIVRLRVAA